MSPGGGQAEAPPGSTPPVPANDPASRPELSDTASPSPWPPWKKEKIEQLAAASPGPCPWLLRPAPPAAPAAHAHQALSHLWASLHAIPSAQSPFPILLGTFPSPQQLRRVQGPLPLKGSWAQGQIDGPGQMAPPPGSLLLPPPPWITFSFRPNSGVAQTHTMFCLGPQIFPEQL